MIVRKKRASKKLQFELKGKVGSWISPHDSDDYFQGEHLHVFLKEKTIKEAQKKAKEIVDKFLEEHKKIGPQSDPEATFDFSLQQIVWENRFIPAKKATPAVPGTKSSPATTLETRYA